MTRKVHNVDRQRTEEAHFLDRGGPKGTCRSYWTNAGHCYLFGADASFQRTTIYNRDKGMCVGCDEPHFIGWDGEMDHIEGGNTDARCWCPHNLRWVCPEFHRLKHVRVLSGKVGT